MWIWAVWVVLGAVLGGVQLVGSQGALESPELAWLLANESPAPLSLRRITPKSVFLAPTFTSCSEGYRQDAQGRCNKVVKLNQQAQWEFFLQKLNSMYAPPVKEKPPAGPFRLPIPLEEPESTTLLPTPPTTTGEPAGATSITTTQLPTATPTTFGSTSADSAEKPTETPLLIVVANTTEPTEPPTTTTEKEWSSRPSTLLAQTEPTSRTTTELPSTTMTTLPGSTIDCDDCFPTTTPVPSTGGLYQTSVNDRTQSVVEPFTVSSSFIPSYTTTSKPRRPEFRPSTYLPTEYTGDKYQPPSQLVEYSPPKIDTESTATAFRPQSHLRPTTTPDPSKWYQESLPYGTRLDSLPPPQYTTRRSTVRFPSERPTISPSSTGYIRFPIQLSQEQASFWWPPFREQSLWPPVAQRPSPRPWSHREPRPSWIHQ